MSNFSRFETASASPRFQVIPLDEVPSGRYIPEMDRQKPLALVVDDERVIADTLSIILSKNGFATMTAYNAAQALELASAATPDLLLSDVMMDPGMDGTELAMALVERCPHCKVLLFSGHSATRDLLEKSRAAGHDFTLLSKPLHPADLLLRLSETLAVTAE
ncbi:MAG TPA: response regulator [Acidobacteriaceae bacterium]|nr:response regulator [Acidobacteriaceae bacterium]